MIAGHEFNWYEIMSLASICHLPAHPFTSCVWAGEGCGGEGSSGKQRCLACAHFSSWPQMVKMHVSYISLLEEGCPAPFSRWLHAPVLPLH